MGMVFDLNLISGKSIVSLQDSSSEAYPNFWVFSKNTLHAKISGKFYQGLSFEVPNTKYKLV